MWLAAGNSKSARMLSKAFLIAAFIAASGAIPPLSAVAQDAKRDSPNAQVPAELAKAKFVQALKSAREKKTKAVKDAAELYASVVQPVLDKVMASGDVDEAKLINAELAAVKAGKPTSTRSRFPTIGIAGRKFKIAVESATRAEGSEQSSAKSDYIWTLSSQATQSLKARDLNAAVKLKADADQLKQEPLEATVARLLNNAKRIDLISLVDINRDKITGRWQLDNNTLRSSSTAAAYFEFPYTPPEEYDLHVSFAREVGIESISIKCAEGKKPFNFMIGGWRNTVTAFTDIGNTAPNENVTVKRSSACIKNGQVYNCVIKVRQNGFEAFIDDRLITAYDTDYSDIGLNAATPWKHPDRIGIHTFFAGFRIESAEVVEISGSGTVEK